MAPFWPSSFHFPPLGAGGRKPSSEPWLGAIPFGHWECRFTVSPQPSGVQLGTSIATIPRMDPPKAPFGNQSKPPWQVSGKSLGLGVMVTTLAALPYIVWRGMFLIGAIILPAPTTTWLPSAGMVCFWFIAFVVGILGYFFDKIRLSLAGLVLAILSLLCWLLASFL